MGPDSEDPPGLPTVKAATVPTPESARARNCLPRHLPAEFAEELPAAADCAEGRPRRAIRSGGKRPERQGPSGPGQP